MMTSTWSTSRWTVDLEVGTILRLGWPNCVSAVLNFLPGIIMLNFLGTDPNDLAAAGMGFMFVNVAGQSWIMGTGIGSVTLISQAFGAANYVRCGEILQRQLAIHALLVTCIALGWWKCEELLLVLGQPEQIAARTGQFVRWRLAGLPCVAILRDFNCYLLAQRVMQFPMVIGIMVNLLNIVGFAVLIPRLGFVGAPLAITLTNALQAVSLILFTQMFLPHRDAWPQWSIRSALRGWKEILSMGLPAGALQLGEWWAWETNLFFAGSLCSSNVMCAELDVFPIVSNTMVILFCVHSGYSMAAGALVGNALGAGDPARARRISRQTMILVAMIAGLLALGLHSFRHEWGRLFVDNEQIISLTAEVLPWVAMYVFIDSLGPGALVNILRNAGVVRVPAAITCAAFYLIGIPCGLGLTFPRHGNSWGIVGLWAGLVVGLTIQVLSLSVLFFWFLDWQKLADEAQSRSKPTENAMPAIRASSATPSAKALTKQIEYQGVATGSLDAEELSVCGHLGSESFDIKLQNQRPQDVGDDSLNVQLPNTNSSSAILPVSSRTVSDNFVIGKLIGCHSTDNRA